MSRCASRREEPLRGYRHSEEAEKRLPRLLVRPPLTRALSQIQHHSTWSIRLLVRSHPCLCFNLCQASKTRLLNNPYELQCMLGNTDFLINLSGQSNREYRHPKLLPGHSFLMRYVSGCAKQTYGVHLSLACV